MSPTPAIAPKQPTWAGWALLLTSVAFFMVTLDSLVVVTALPAIHRELGGQVSTLEWAVNAYLLIFAAGIITAASIGERFGRRRVYVAGLALFSLASAACALAPSTTLLIAARAMQGLGAAIVTPLSLTILTTAFGPERRGRVIGIWGSIAGLAVAAGPLVGGGVTQGLSWHWVFWVNVPVGLAGAALSRLRLPEAPASGAALDLVGAVSASLGALAVIWSLVESGGTNWDATNLGLMAGGLVVLAAFLAWERRAAAPMVPTRLFRDLQFSAANATAFFAYGAIFSAAFLMSQYFQMSLGYGPLATGLRFLPWTATPLFIAPLAGALSDKLGARPLMTLGLAMQAAGLAWVALLAGHTASYAEIVVPLVIAGVGISMAIPTMPLAVMGAVAPPDMGTASGVFNMLQRFGGVVAVAVASAVFVSNGHLGTAVSFDNGFRPALLVPAGLSVLGSVSAILARRPRAKAVDLTGAGGQQEKTTAGAAAA